MLIQLAKDTVITKLQIVPCGLQLSLKSCGQPGRGPHLSLCHELNKGADQGHEEVDWQVVLGFMLVATPCLS
jgi:hypothetical protein